MGLTPRWQQLSRAPRPGGDSCLPPYGTQRSGLLMARRLRPLHPPLSQRRPHTHATFRLKPMPLSSPLLPSKAHTPAALELSGFRVRTAARPSHGTPTLSFTRNPKNSNPKPTRHRPEGPHRCAGVPWRADGVLPALSPRRCARSVSSARDSRCSLTLIFSSCDISWPTMSDATCSMLGRLWAAETRISQIGG
eukprot:353940-Chlamydomonas_euryale.AAC.2